MDLSNSKNLTVTPDFSGIPKLEGLDLSGCTNLLYVHPPIGLLKKLAFLSLRNCRNLVSIIFDSESNMSSLRVLHFSGCTKLENMPDFTRTTNLEYLDFDGCPSLSLVNESIGAIAKLAFLSFRDCKNLVSIPNSINTMISLQTLDLCGCLKLPDLPLRQTFNFSSQLQFLIVMEISFCNLLKVPDAIGELRCLERLNLQGNKFVSIPSSIMKLHCLAYLNLSHCHELVDLPDLPSVSASSGGRYFKTVSGSRDHRSGLYLFDCPKLANKFSIDSKQVSVHWNEMSSCNGIELAWLIRLIEEPYNFRCGFDIVVPSGTIPSWFNKTFNEDSVTRINHCNMDDNWIGFAFCVLFERNNDPAVSDPAVSGSSHGSFSWSRLFYLSFESENTEECFNMPLNLELDKTDRSKHLWLIYISRQHCHFVKTGAHITFKAKACSVIKILKWGMSSIFRQDIDYLKRMQLGEPLPLDYHGVHDINSEYVRKEKYSFRVEKFKLPYNWLVKEEDEVENIEAKAKENNLTNAGL